MDKPKALTIKELKMMIGKPVFVVRENRKEWCLIHSYHLSEIYGGGIIVTTRTSQKKTLPYHAFCISWRAYDKEVRCIDYCECRVFKPETDAVPVVRCKDCEYWMYEYDDVGLCAVDVPDVDGVERHAYDFCSHGERKDDEH